jgi:hypothetical protein
MKKGYYILIIIFLSSKVLAFGQMRGIPNLTTYDDKRVHFGFTLGMNTLDLNFKHYHTLDDNPLFNPAEVSALNPNHLLELDSVGRSVRADIPTLMPGFTVGIVSNLRITENLDLRFLPGLSFGSRRIVFNVPIHDLNEPSNVEDYTIRSTYLDFPFLLKYKSKRIINQRPYMISGLAFRYDISKSAVEELFRLKNATVFAEAGMGWDVYLQFFRLSTELKYSFGLNNSLAAPPIEPQPKYYNLAFKCINAHMLTLSFHFE